MWKKRKLDSDRELLEGDMVGDMFNQGGATFLQTFFSGEQAEGGVAVNGFGRDLERLL